eukprot:14880266-Alexandrium_andersonii.AAC.1
MNHSTPPVGGAVEGGVEFRRQIMLRERLGCVEDEQAEQHGDPQAHGLVPVSYTHLTLPTICSV